MEKDAGHLVAPENHGVLKTKGSVHIRETQEPT